MKKSIFCSASHKWLMDEPSVSFQPSLAKYLKGVGEAVLLQQIFFWQQTSTVKAVIRGELVPVVERGIPDWQLLFPFMKERSIWTKLNKLQRSGLLDSVYRGKQGHVLSYRVNEEKYDEFVRQCVKAEVAKSREAKK